ncbi:hypothetical protein [Nitrosococcus oceani]|uniref:AsmA domain-containing protein n=2 Tax=Nitrosococcus oceani TaxID=1229 RepID=Q3JCG1_NITOC|nr:hypothetical protein [Nitrosococcus oceani]KFI19983.1 hypothetical protein IB75_04995 [Nitrosococcus oceani C-27]ABA57485.1 hypothetical protein Noc_0975 [Nitrosococcus oceani ATCC 19707]EDZ67615.1 hypothetical protein NOC27_942 [Nitrosococcus oceani AFC27]KFI23240.1 hypothetical protein HW44_04865 [Nitrosococcus oceani]GEM20728.1 hypothetical protein NONS58_21480 [Nitrosococcus oceani]
METGEMILVGTIAFIAIVSVALIYAWFSLNGLIKAAIERYGTQITQTRVQISTVKIAPTAGGGTISRLTISNPPGFSSSSLIALDTISIKIDASTLRQNPIIIKEIIFHSPQVFFEISLSGKSNIGVLRKNIVTAGEFIPLRLKQTGKKEIKLVIQRLTIEEGQIHAAISGLEGRQLTGKLPRLELTDIGNEKGGFSPKEMAEEIIAALINPVDSAASKLRAKTEEYLRHAL